MKSAEYALPGLLSYLSVTHASNSRMWKTLVLYAMQMMRRANLEKNM